MSDWSAVQNAEEIPSPALLLYPERIRENITRMVRISGGTHRLRPHIKTHKLPEIVRMQLDARITKCKCATIAEAEMAATTGVRDILIAYPMVGPNVRRLLDLVNRFRESSFSCLADDLSGVSLLSKTFENSGTKIEVLLDIDCGQHRTGTRPDSAAGSLYRLLATSPGLRPGGLHVYDGHIHETNLTKRTELCAAAFGAVHAFRESLLSAGLAVPRVVAGGTPTFPIHAKNETFECSPGTCVLWDHGYASRFPDMDFLIAALVLTRVVSKPGANRLCLDLGHKAIASENPPPRVNFLNLPDATSVSHSEEHLVIETNRAGQFNLGDCLFGAPLHICPTVALHSEAVVIRDGRATERWRVTARERRLTV
jgi:D-serine deaminase-like pyridoxal phosphate-dependent protein